MARRGDDESELSVLRTEDVPLQEVSGVCLRREAGGDMALVAFGDRTSIAAWVDLPSDDGGVYTWQTVDMADVEGSQIPRDDPQVEAVCADGAGRILILQESPPRVELLDWAGHRVVTRIALEVPDGHPLHASWVDAEGSQGEGAAFMQNGHLLIAKEKDPSAFVEFGPDGEAPVRVRPRSRPSRAAPPGRRTPAIACSCRSPCGCRRSSSRPAAPTSATSRSGPIAASTC